MIWAVLTIYYSTLLCSFVAVRRRSPPLAAARRCSLLLCLNFSPPLATTLRCVAPAALESRSGQLFPLLPLFAAAFRCFVPDRRLLHRWLQPSSSTRTCTANKQAHRTRTSNTHSRKNNRKKKLRGGKGGPKPGLSYKVSFLLLPLFCPPEDVELGGASIWLDVFRRLF